MGSPVKTDTKMLGSGKMRLCVLFAFISVIVTMPRTQEEDTEDVQMLEEEAMRQLLKDLFISSRGARQLDINDEDSEADDLADVTDEADEASDDDASVMEDSEAKMKAREDEVSRFNNYIDAIYRRMNAALRAKMMDPMTLNLDDRQKKKQSPRRSLNKREADGDYNVDEEDDDGEAVLAEDELQSRAGKPERANKNKPRNGAAARRSKKNKKSKKGEKEQKGTKKAEREAAKKE